ncbi:MAG: hypothetical protein WBC91_04425 [Phototrophicaceae bacterium]
MVTTREIVRQRTQRQLAPPLADAACCNVVYVWIRNHAINTHISDLYEGEIAQ